MSSLTNSEVDQITRKGEIIGNYSCIQLLGKGGFGQVYKAINGQSKQIVALKIIDKQKIEKEKSPRIKEIKRRLIKSQSEIMLKCNSDHVVKCYQRFQNSQQIIFVLEFCNQKDLSVQIRQRKKIPEHEAIKILKQIIKGFAELHNHKIIHRDLKSQNIFKHNDKYKIGDLGFAKIIPNLMEMNQGTTLGTMTTMAPEIMKQGKYGIKADIWSLGMIYYQMLYGRLPIRFLNKEQMIKDVQNQIPYPPNENCSQESTQLLKRLLVPDPNKRISWQQLYDHPLLKYNQNSLIFDDNFNPDVSLDQSRKIHFTLETDDAKYDIQSQLKQPQQIPDIVFANATFKKTSNNQKFQKNVQQVEQTKKIEMQILKYTDELSFEKQRSKIIFDNIINLLLTHFKPSKNKRIFYQFLYLVICRCFFIISPIYDALKHKKNTFDWEYYEEFLKSELSASFLREFTYHYETISTKKLQIEQLLFKQQSKMKSVVVDFFSKIFQNDQFVQKQKFSVGIEDKDYKKEEQIQYTMDNYFDQIKEDIQIIVEKNHTLYIYSMKFNKFLKQYKKVNESKFKQDYEYIQRISKQYS